MDPVDSFPTGAEALKYAAGHKGFASTAVWQPKTWAMPSHPKGRFYNGEEGSTPADLRLQQQGNFRFMVEVPVDATLPADEFYILGSVYVHYSIYLSKPTIASQFIGTSMQQTWTADPEHKFSADDANVLTTLFNAGIEPVLNAKSNLIVPFVEGPSSLYGLRLAPGVYVVSVILTKTGAAATTWDFAPISSVNDGAWSTANVDSGTYGGTPYVPTIAFYSMAGTTTDAHANYAWRITVPTTAHKYLLSFGVVRSAGAGDLLVEEVQINVDITLPGPEEKEYFNPSAATLSKRLDQIERRLSVRRTHRKGMGHDYETGGDEKKQGLLVDDSSESDSGGMVRVLPHGLRVQRLRTAAAAAPAAAAAHGGATLPPGLVETPKKSSKK
jgi:hypothetical protein